MSANSAIREFLDGLAVMIARRILEGEKEPHVEYVDEKQGESTC
jgi:hypothetical protein